MTLYDIKLRVLVIENLSKFDDEGAHSREDELREDFIKYVAAHGDKKLKEMAEEILKTSDMDFARWCA
jgi:hypothetical protein